MNYYLIPLALLAGFSFGYFACLGRDTINLKDGKAYNIKNAARMTARTPDGTAFAEIDFIEGKCTPIARIKKSVSGETK